MPMEDNEAVYEKLGETEKRFGLLRDRFRLSVIAISEAEAKKQGLEIAESVVACISDLAFKFTEVLANDVGLFAQHAGRKSINMEDVILSAHRNEHLLGLLRSFSNDLKGKEQKIGKTRKRPLKEGTLS
ncbi:MHF histone-fold complex subunit 1 isoform X2 [Phalaenopsis equestris]|uniref:MHF histone-fold complex subunit 1 isoform X2 n=1 Tax=Phalaenopsis equestris TaxID=78828 RepID=UPI0009E29FBE|nr:MHF histone-fold complex subunit 1 isoform X2 [Phalaenopsis equestris]